MRLPTREYKPGVGWVTEDANFQQYGDPQSSAAGWWRLMQSPLYRDVLNSPDLTQAITAIGRSPYATDPAYGSKLSRLSPQTPEQRAFYQQRIDELTQTGAPPVLAELGARQSALETGWGRSAPGNNFFGIKAPAGAQPVMLAQAGRPDIEQGLFAEMPDMGGQMAPQGPEQPQAPGFFDRLNAAMSSPLFMTGASILANNQGNYGAAAPAIGRGLVGGQLAASTMREDTANAQARQLQAKLAQKKAEEEQRYFENVEAYIRTLPVEQQAQARIAPGEFIKAQLLQKYGKNAAQYGVQPHYEVDKEGNYYKVRYADDGTQIVEKMDRAPAQLEMRTPGYIGQQAEARAQGQAKGTAAAETLNKYSDDIAQIRNTQQTIEELAALPGRTAATGIGSLFRTWPGGDAADYEAKLQQLKGQNFLAMIPNMKGMGALSNAEGDALREAASDLKLSQSDEQHARSLAKLYAVLGKGMERIRTRKLLGPGQEVDPPSQAEIDAMQKRLFSGVTKPGNGQWKIERMDSGGGF